MNIRVTNEPELRGLRVVVHRAARAILRCPTCADVSVVTRQPSDGDATEVLIHCPRCLGRWPSDR